jgi:hypothetical protein
VVVRHEGVQEGDGVVGGTLEVEHGEFVVVREVVDALIIEDAVEVVVLDLCFGEPCLNV